jgi:hypothetical protein
MPKYHADGADLFIQQNSNYAGIAQINTTVFIVADFISRNGARAQRLRNDLLAINYIRF